MLQFVSAANHLFKLFDGTVTKYLHPNVHIKNKVGKILFICEKRSSLGTVLIAAGILN